MDVFFVTQGIAFSWDSRKAAANAQKHRVTFEEASQAFFDPFVRALPPRTEDGEARQAILGLTASWKLVHVAFALRDDYVRIISARLATPLQRKKYEDDPAS